MCVLHPGVQPSTWYVQAEKCREIERELAAARADAARWKFAWEHDLMLHMWDGAWWCSRVDVFDDTHEYPKAATAEAAIDAAMTKEPK